MKYVLFIFLILFSFRISRNEEITICNVKYLKKKGTYYDKDLNINVKNISVNNFNNRKFLFGYFDSSYRNDTLFIYSVVKNYNSGFLIKDYYNFRISSSTDSTIRTFSCHNGKIIFKKYDQYYNGVITKSTFFNNALN